MDNMSWQMYTIYNNEFQRYFNSQIFGNSLTTIIWIQYVVKISKHIVYPIENILSTTYVLQYVKYCWMDTT